MLAPLRYKCLPHFPFPILYRLILMLCDNFFSEHLNSTNDDSSRNVLLTVYSRIGTAFGPMGQRMDCDLVGVIFTIRIGENATQ